MQNLGSQQKVQCLCTARSGPFAMGLFQVFANIIVRLMWCSPTSASVWPHKKPVKKIEAEGVKEKQMLLILGAIFGP
jgi:hypothetical protein